MAEQLSTIQEAVRDHQWDEAAAQVNELRVRAPRTPELPALTEEVEQGRLSAKRLADVEEYLSDARRRKASEDLPGALSRVDAALALCPDHPDATVLRQEIEELALEAELRREAEAAARRKAGQEAVNVWLDEADSALRAGRFDEALTALDEVNQDVATATQSLRFHGLRQDAENRREKARVERIALRQQRLEQARTRLRELGNTGVSAARHAAADRKVQVGVAATILVTLLVWSLIPSGPPGGQQAGAGDLEDVTRMASSVPPIAPASSAPRPRTQSAAPVTDGPRSAASPVSDAPADAAMRDAPVGIGSRDGDGAEEGTDAAPEVPVAESGEESSTVTDPVQQALTGLSDLVDARSFGEALQRLDSLDGSDPRVTAARSQVERVWNGAAEETAARAREFSSAGDFAAALSLVDSFGPEHGFVESARADVERAWAAESEALSRRALQMAAAGDHEAAVALLEASVPPHPAVLTTLDDLRANPECSDELPAVSAALTSLTLDTAVSAPSFGQACSGPYRFEIQNELVRFGAGCERASATAFVPVLCEGSSDWTDPGVFRFVLRKSGDTWSITESAVMESVTQPR